MANKGQIHGEIRDFLEIFSNLIKSDYELVIKIRENGRFRKITQRRIHRIKNHLIWISNRGEIKERKVERNLRKSEEQKTEIKDAIKLNYDPKLQIDDT